MTIKHLIPAHPEPCHLLYCDTSDDLANILAYVRASDVTWAIDIETMAKPGYQASIGILTDPKTSNIRTVQLYDGGKYTFVLDCMKTPELLEELAKILPHKKLLAHNAKFELSFLKYNDVPVEHIGCTMLMRKLLYRAEHSVFDVDGGASDGGRYNYGATVYAYLGVELPKDIDHSQWGAPNLNFEQLSYCALDVFYLWHVGEVMASQIVSYGFKDAYILQRDAQHPIVAMEDEGVVFDTEQHILLIDKWKKIMTDALDEFYAVVGHDKYNVTKPKSVRQYVAENIPEDELAHWPLTASGLISLSANVLQEYMHHPAIAAYAVFTKYKSLLSKYGNKLRDWISPVSGKIHTQYVLCGAVTGRMSSKQPNLQNIPRGKEVRKLFTAAEGEAIICADYGQIELRVAAILSGDPVMIDAYNTGKDIHRLTAAGTAGVAYEEVTKEQRTAAKALNFGLIYGMGWKKFIAHAKWNYGVTFDEDEAKHAIAMFRETYSTYYAWQIAQGKMCERLLYSDTVLGHRRALDEEYYYTAGINHPIQGSAGHVLLRALIRLNELFRKCPDYNARLCLTVHDEISCYCPLEDAATVKGLVEQEMVAGFLDIFPTGSIRDLVEAHIGPDWAEAK